MNVRVAGDEHKGIQSCRYAVFYHFFPLFITDIAAAVIVILGEDDLFHFTAADRGQFMQRDLVDDIRCIAVDDTAEADDGRIILFELVSLVFHTEKMSVEIKISVQFCGKRPFVSVTEVIFPFILDFLFLDILCRIMGENRYSMMIIDPFETFRKFHDQGIIGFLAGSVYIENLVDKVHGFPGRNTPFFYIGTDECVGMITVFFVPYQLLTEGQFLFLARPDITVCFCKRNFYTKLRIGFVGEGTEDDAKNFFGKVRLNMGLRVLREVRADKVTKELSDFECPRALSKNFKKEGYI